MQRVAAASAVLGPLLILAGFVGALSRPHQHSTASLLAARTASPVSAVLPITSAPRSTRQQRTAARTPSPVSAVLPATPPPSDPPPTRDIGRARHQTRDSHRDPPPTRGARATPSPNIQEIDRRVETQVAAPAVTAAAAYTQTAVANKRTQSAVRTPVPGGPLVLGQPIEEAIARFGRPADGGRPPAAYAFLPCAHGGGTRWSVQAQQGLIISITRRLCPGERLSAPSLQELGAHLPAGTIFLGQAGPVHGTLLRFYTSPVLQAAQFTGQVGYGMPGCNGGGDPAGTLFASVHLDAGGSLDRWTVSIGGCWKLP